MCFGYAPKFKMVESLTEVHQGNTVQSITPLAEFLSLNRDHISNIQRMFTPGERQVVRRIKSWTKGRTNFRGGDACPLGVAFNATYDTGVLLCAGTSAYVDAAERKSRVLGTRENRNNLARSFSWFIDAVDGGVHLEDRAEFVRAVFADEPPPALVTAPVEDIQHLDQEIAPQSAPSTVIDDLVTAGLIAAAQEQLVPA